MFGFKLWFKLCAGIIGLFFFQSFVGSKEASNNPRDDPVVLEEKDCKPSSDDDTVHKLKEEAQSQRQI